MYRKSIVVSLALLFCCSLMFSQNEFNMWYFGNNAALDFNGGSPPTALTNSAMNAHEGVSTICDSAGNLLFYTDGLTIWNRNHVPMTNGTGLFGNGSSTMSSIILPVIGSNTQYYVFTADFWVGSPRGINYSIVDMTLSSGLGAVTATKNIPVLNPAAEKICAVRHANCTDWWVIAHGRATNDRNFHAFPVTAAGVGPGVVSTVGAPVGGNWARISYLIPTWDGTMLIHAMWNNITEILDFNRTTGVVSNARTLSTTVTGAYGACMSPNDSLIYLAQAFGGQGVYQFQRFAANPSATQTLVGTIPNGPAAMQVGPDDILYIVRRNFSGLSEIRNPNGIGAACNFVLNGVGLAGRTNDMGLPYQWHPAVRPDSLCTVILPVQLTAFTARNAGLSNVIEWTTTHEHNSQTFEIQRSADSRGWTTIGAVAAAGFTSTEVDYSWTDRSPLTGDNWYRLRQLDLDGAEHFSRMVNVRFERDQAAGILDVWPQPAAQQLQVRMRTETAGQHALQLYDLTGKLVRDYHMHAPEIGFQQTTLELGGIARGVYVLRLQDGARVYAQRVTVE